MSGIAVPYSWRDVLTDRAHLEVRAGAGGNGSLSFRREAHVPKGGPDGGDGGRGGDVILRCDDSLRDLQSFRRRAHFRAERGGHGQGKQLHGADGDALIVAVPPGTQVERWDGTRYDLVRARPGGHDRARRRRRARQHALQAPDAAGAAARRARAAGGGGARRAAPQAARRRRPRRAAQRRQVVAARAADARAAEGRRLPVHDARAGARHARRRRPPARDRRHPGPDRGRQRRRRARPRLPRPRRAHAAARPRARPRAARRLRPGREPRGDRGASSPSTTRGWPSCRASSRCRRPTSSPPEVAERRAPRVGASGSATVRRSSSPRRATGQGLDELRRELLRRVPRRRAGARGARARTRSPSSRSSGRRAGRAFEVERTGDGTVPRQRRGGRPPDRAPRPRERRGARARRAAPAADGRDRRARGEGFEPGDDVELGGVVFELDPS